MDVHYLCFSASLIFLCPYSVGAMGMYTDQPLCSFKYIPSWCSKHDSSQCWKQLLGVYILLPSAYPSVVLSTVHSKDSIPHFMMRHFSFQCPEQQYKHKIKALVRKRGHSRGALISEAMIKTQIMDFNLSYIECCSILPLENHLSCIFTSLLLFAIFLLYFFCVTFLISSNHLLILQQMKPLKIDF